LQHTFSYLSLGLALPAVFYSASHIFVSAYHGLKQRVLKQFQKLNFPVIIARQKQYVSPGVMEKLQQHFGRTTFFEKQDSMLA
jgi:hypothetical protein